MAPSASPVCPAARNAVVVRCYLEINQLRAGDSHQKTPLGTYVHYVRCLQISRIGHKPQGGHSSFRIASFFLCPFSCFFLCWLFVFVPHCLSFFLRILALPVLFPLPFSSSFFLFFFFLFFLSFFLSFSSSLSFFLFWQITAFLCYT